MRVRPTVAVIDPRALADNFRHLRSVIGPNVGVIAVVKADAYGHGAVPVARLLEGLGVRGFGVATVEEGIELREQAIRSPILIMGAAFGDDHQAVIEYDLTPVVGDLGDIEYFAHAAEQAGKLRFGIHVKVDTGMSRLGVVESQFERFIRLSAKHTSLRVDGLATHFASAECPDPQPTLDQLRRFITCLDQARAMGADPQLIHAANSAAALRFPQSRFDLIRPGIVLYGALPGDDVPDPGFQPVMSLHTQINALRHVPTGTPVSYGGTFVTDRPSVIATLPVGYADGYPRALSSRAEVLLRHQRAPVVGRICMDLTMIDVTDVPGASVGDRVTLLGCDGKATIRAEEVANWANTIPYEILAGISKRVPRLYPGGEHEMKGDSAG